MRDRGSAVRHGRGVGVQPHLATLAGVATAALGRRITVADLPPAAATTPRVEVLTGLGVTEPDELCELWLDPALATVAGTALFPGCWRD